MAKKELDLITFEQAQNLPAGEDCEYMVEDQFHRLKIKKGIARIFDTHNGTIYECYPNIHSSGSVSGMKAKGYWQKDAKTIRLGGVIFNISSLIGDKNNRWEVLVEKLSTAHLY